jgi:hypothetical protein
MLYGKICIVTKLLNHKAHEDLRQVRKGLNASIKNPNRTKATTIPAKME